MPGVAADGGTLPFGDPAIDGHLPGGGLPLGTLHEVLPGGDDAGAAAAGTAFAAGLIGRLSARGPVFWIMPRDDLYGPGLAPFGIDPDRLILVLARDDREMLAAMEDALRGEGTVAVLGEAGRLGAIAGRRLKLACERSGATALLLRRSPDPGSGRGQPHRRGEPSAAATRWRIAPALSMPTEPGVGPPRWRVTLVHCRGGREGSWIMEAGDAPGHVRVVAELAGGAAEAAAPPARAAG